jgi:putative oxidoreductase
MTTLAMTEGSGLRGAATRLIGIVERVPLSVLQTTARLAIAAVFWRSGQTKIASWDLTLQLFRDEYHVPLLPPEIAAPLAAATELSMPVLLILGLASRLATLPLLAMTLIIQIFVYPTNWPEHLTWATLLLLILIRGAGPLSLDRLISRFRDR